MRIFRGTGLMEKREKRSRAHGLIWPQTHRIKGNEKEKVLAGKGRRARIRQRRQEEEVKSLCGSGLREKGEKGSMVYQLNWPPPH